MSDKVLFVDDEVNVLNTFRRQLMDRFEVYTAQGGAEGLETINIHGPFAVIISDLRMPIMDGTRFLAEVKKRVPDSVRVILTGHADLEAAIDTVNKGHIFRFLTKPCSQDVLIQTINASIDLYRLITAERELLDKTLSGSVKVLTEVLGLVNPTAFGRALRIERYVKQMVERLNLEQKWQFNLAAMLSLIGCVTLDPDTLDKYYADVPLSKEEKEVFDAHPTVGRNLLSHIPRLGIVARMIEAQGQPFNRRMTGDNFEGEDPIALGGHLLKVATEFDQQILHGKSVEVALKTLSQQPGEYCPEVVAILENLDVYPVDKIEKTVKVKDLNTTMTLDDDIRAKNGMLIAVRGQEVTYTMLQRLRAFARSVGVVEPFRVVIESPTIT